MLNLCRDLFANDRLGHLDVEFVYGWWVVS